MTLRNARRGAPQLLLGAVLTAFLVLAIVATSVSGSSAAPAQASRAGALCQIEAFPSGGGGNGANGKRGGARASIEPGNLAKGLGRFVVEKAVGANLERWGVQGLSGFFRVIGLGGIAPDAEQRAMLGQLRAINTRLGEVEVRIDRVGSRVNRLIGERRRADLNQAIIKACTVATEQIELFRTYTTALESGLDLAKVVEGRATASASEREALESRVVENIIAFTSEYQQGRVRYGAQIVQLRRLLVPNTSGLGTTPVLTTFGKVLLSRDRFLHRADSEAMRGLYFALSEIRALATLMAAEYFDGLEMQADEERVLREFLTDTRNAERGLPKMIPPGVVVDLGSDDRDSANRMPMWFAPTKKDLGWIPRQYAGLQEPIAVEEVDDALRNLNSRKPWGKGWSAPTKEEFEALISTGCRVDPDHPARALRGCRNAVPAGSNIAAYLQRLNKEDEDWQQLFCARLTNPKCPPKAGPTRVRQKPHAFVWTSDRHSQRLICGTRHYRRSLNREQVAVRYVTHAGFHTLAADARFHEVFPHLPQTTEGRRSATGPENLPYIREACHSYFRSLVLGPPGQRNHLTEGVLLATRHTGRQDANPKSHWDFMAQPVPGS